MTSNSAVDPLDVQAAGVLCGAGEGGAGPGALLPLLPPQQEVQQGPAPHRPQRLAGGHAVPLPSAVNDSSMKLYNHGEGPY